MFCMRTDRIGVHFAQKLPLIDMFIELETIWFKVRLRPQVSRNRRVNVFHSVCPEHTSTLLGLPDTIHPLSLYFLSAQSYRKCWFMDPPPEPSIVTAIPILFSCLLLSTYATMFSVEGPPPSITSASRFACAEYENKTHHRHVLHMLHSTILPPQMMHLPKFS